MSPVAGRLLSDRLPRCSAHDAPSGEWQREYHLEAPVVPFMEPALVAFGRGFARGFAQWGFPLAGIGQLLVDGWLYLSPEPLTDPDEFVRRLARTEQVADLAELTSVAQRWIDQLLPHTDAARRSIAAGDITALADDELGAALVAAHELVCEFAEQRFADLPAVNLLTAALLVDGEQAGLARAQCLALLAGSSRATTALVRDVASAGVDLIDEYIDDGLSTDPCAPGLIDVSTRWWTGSSGAAAVPVAPADAPGQIAAALATARMAQDVREASRSLLVRLIGRARRISVEIGRRLAAAGAVEAADDVLFLAPDELLELFSAGGGGGGELRARVRSRRHEYAAARAVTPPAVVGVAEPFLAGPPPGAPPMAPGALRMLTLAMTWMAATDGDPMTQRPAGADALVLTGVGASRGTVTGRARVVLHVADLLSFEPGEIMVCTATTPAWCVAIAVAAGLVTDVGGDCSHASITAREFAIPAVAGAAGATTALRTGDLVTLDGDTGTVTVHPET
jgi:phosphohistidine swiveling domain-containing protein